MNIEQKRKKLKRRLDYLKYEKLDIQEEITILHAMIKKADVEMSEIQDKLSRLEKPSSVKFAYGG